VGDVLALPVRTDAVDGVLAAFVLSHLERPVAGLIELRRVVRPGGAVLATVFSDADRPPLKDRIDAVAASFGWEPPRWEGDVGAVRMSPPGRADRADPELPFRPPPLLHSRTGAPPAGVPRATLRRRHRVLAAGGRWSGGC
jgi:SAM-dependent methyltransferase